MPSIISLGDLVGDAGPDVDDLVVALAVGDQTFLVLLDDALDFVLRVVEELLLPSGMTMCVHADRDAGLRRVLEAERAQAVGEEHRLLVAVLAVADVDERRERLLVERLVDVVERDARRAGSREMSTRPTVVSTMRVRCVALVVEIGDAHLDAGVQVDLAVVVRHAHFVGRREDAAQVALELALLVDRERAVAVASPSRTCARASRSRARARCPASG